MTRQDIPDLPIEPGMSARAGEIRCPERPAAPDLPGREEARA